MLILKERVAKFFVQSIIGGVILTFVSLLFRSELVLAEPPHILPCVMQVFQICERQIMYGFPMFWLKCLNGVNMIGCGPVVGHFSKFFFLWQGFLVDVSFYAFCLSLILYYEREFKLRTLIKS